MRRTAADCNQMKVTKAIFPVAGLGTRFLPATKAQPKEMLPVVDKPLIQYAVEEAYAAGVREMIFVTGRHKRALEDHFDLGARTGLEVDVLGAGADPPDRLQDRRIVQRLRVERDRGRHDHCSHVVQCPAKLARVEGELGCMDDAVAFAQPLHHFGLKRIDDQQIHAARPCG